MLGTGPMGSEPGVLNIRPERARNGRVVRPARLWLPTRESALAVHTGDVPQPPMLRKLELTSLFHVGGGRKGYGAN